MEHTTQVEWVVSEPIICTDWSTDITHRMVMPTAKDAPTHQYQPPHPKTCAEFKSVRAMKVALTE